MQTTIEPNIDMQSYDIIIDELKKSLRKTREELEELKMAVDENKTEAKQGDITINNRITE